ncbi:MAG: methionyl-tRNA formyltransferase [Oscillospiraceae bacterium]|jgi:methionyl-tRNA formyltransferase|nr:methionyl-tRNA formyltransferase [Oscillospiraceae bacterium]
MKLIFMGTPEFAVPALDALINAGHEIPLIFTQPDKPSGRGQKVRFSPVKEYALAKDLEVFQPMSLRRGDDSGKSLELIKEINPDIIIVAAYGQILPEVILEFPRYGCVNIHASLLPRWRGAAPVNFCIMNGDKESGVTIMQMDAGIDTGDMLLFEKCEITDTMTASRLHDVLKEIGARLIVKFAENPEECLKCKTAQNNELATYAPMITKQMKEIDWNKSSADIYNFVRGLSGEAYTFIDNRRLKVFSSEIVETLNNKLDFICGDKRFLRLLEVQPEGKSKMKADEFLRGFRKE